MSWWKLSLSDGSTDLSCVPFMFTHSRLPLNDWCFFDVVKAGGRGRLQAKRWETHHYQSDVTSYISGFQNGAHFCCSLSSHKNGNFNGLADPVPTFCIQLFRERLSEKSTKLHKPIPKDSMGRRIELLHVLNTNEI